MRGNGCVVKAVSRDIYDITGPPHEDRKWQKKEQDLKCQCHTDWKQAIYIYRDRWTNHAGDVHRQKEKEEEEENIKEKPEDKKLKKTWEDRITRLMGKRDRRPRNRKYGGYTTYGN